jgi:5-formyltetrahydrofolate cyclo-ligase
MELSAKGDQALRKTIDHLRDLITDLIAGQFKIRHGAINNKTGFRLASVARLEPLQLDPTKLESMDKKSLRKHLLKTRQQLTTSDWRSCSHQITERLLAQSCLKPGQTVLAYFSIRQEPDLTSLWEGKLGLDLGLNLGFPRCEEDSRLMWHRWQLGEALVAGAFGILEPPATNPEIQAAEVDWILVPCVGCDRRGYRIGYGGGFYDRLLEKPEWRKVQTIGITFEFGIVEDLGPEAWDQPLNYVCTEKDWIAFNQ